VSNDISDIRLVIQVIANTSQLDKFAASMGKVNSATMAGQRMQSNAAAQVGAASRGWQKFSEKLAVTERKMDAVFRAGVHLQAMGRDLTGAGMALFNFAGDIVSRYAKYDFILRATGVALNTNVEWQKKLDKAIQDTAITLGKYKPEEVAEAYRLWGAATGDVVDSQASLARITKTVEKILIATGMAGGTVEGNIKGIYGVLKQYNMRMDDAGHVTEVLSVLTERTAANFGDLTGAFIYTGSAIGNVGGTFEDTAQVLGILADAGYRGSKAGRGLSMVFEAFLSPSTKKAEKALNALAKRASGGKKSWADLITPIKNGKRHFVGIRKTVDDLAKAMKDMGPIERQQAINAIFTNNAARAMLPTINAQIHLWDEQAKSGKKLTSIFDEQKYSLKTASSFFAQMSDQFKGSMDSLIGSFQNSLFPIMQMLAVEIMKIAGPILKFLSGKFKELAAWLEKNPALVELLVKFGAIAAIILVVVGSFFTLLGTIALFMSNIFLVGAALMPLVAIVAGLIAGIIALGIAFMNNTHGIRDAFGKLADAVKRFFDLFTGGDKGRTKMIEDITGALKDLSLLILDKVIDIMKGITDWLNSLSPADVENIKTLAINLGKVLAVLLGFKAATAIVGTVFGILKGAVMFLAGPIIGVVRGFLAFQGALQGIISILPMVGVAAGPISWIIMGIIAAIAAFVVAYETNFMGFKDFIDGIVNWLVNTALPAVIGFFNQIAAVVGPILAAIGDFITNSVIPALNQIVVWIGETFGPVVAQFLDMWNSISVFIGEVVNQISIFFGQLGDAIRTFFGFFGDSTNESKGTVDDWGTTIAAIMKGLGDFITNVVLPYFNGFFNFVKGIFEAIATVIKGAFQIIEGIFKVATALLTGNWSMFWDGIHDIISGAWDILVGVVKGIFGAIEQAIRTALGIVDGILKTIFGDGPGSFYGSIKGAIQTFAKFGGDLIGGIVKGIGDAINWAIKQVTGFMESIWKGVTDFFGIKSPSTLFADIGKNIVQGLWNGIVGLKDWITNKMMDFIKSVIPGPVLDALGIHSPSRVMAELGAFAVMGLAKGITDNANLVTDAMNAVTGSMVAVADSAAASVTLGDSTFNNVSSSSATKDINLNVNVESADGSVSSLDMNTLADLITGSSMTRALERMAATD